jgi:hypothetical protein
MKKIIYISFLLTIAVYDSCAQNLVPNGSFEEYKKIPNGAVFIIDDYLEYWVKPTRGSPDYYHTLSTGSTSIPVQKVGYSYTDSSLQDAKEGSAFVGFAQRLSDSGTLIYAEYIQVPLTEFLKKNHRYRFSSYWNLLDISKYKGIEFGLVVSKDRDTSYRDENTFSNTLFENEIRDYFTLENSHEINYTDWTNLGHSIKSTGGEKWLTIGSFDYRKKYSEISRSDVNYAQGAGKVAYYFIDDVSLVEIPTLVGPDTVCAGEVIELYSSFYGENCAWYDDADRLSVLSTDTFLRLTANYSRWYYLETDGGSDSLYITVVPRPRPSVISDTFYCAGDSVQVVVLDSSLSSFAEISWSDGDTSFSKYMAETGVYSFKVDNGFCSVDGSFDVQESPLPQKASPAEYVFCQVEEEEVEILLRSDYAYSWVDDEIVSNPRIFYAGGVYPLVAYTDDGCISHDTIHIVDQCLPVVYVPNAFVINGVNQTFKPYLRYIENCQMSIYTRWGQKIYETSGLEPYWDGKINGVVQLEGVYLYTLFIASDNGNRSESGTFHLLKKQ